MAEEKMAALCAGPARA